MSVPFNCQCERTCFDLMFESFSQMLSEGTYLASLNFSRFNPSKVACPPVTYSSFSLSVPLSYFFDKTAITCRKNTLYPQA